MDLQAVYESISKFWNQISPILIAHVIFFMAWLWIRKSNLNLLVSIEKALETKTYQRWKQVFDEFSLRPTIPFLSILIILTYFVILGDTLSFLAGGLFSPLSIRYSEMEFWQETYNDGVIYQIADLIAYHGNVDSSVDSKVYEALDFKNNMLEEYRTRYPSQYDAFVNWRAEQQGEWNRYYQLSIAGFIVISILFVPAVNKKIDGLSNKRLMAVLVLSLMSVFLSRYQAEVAVEKTLHAELSFVTLMLRQDESFADIKIDDNQQGDIVCSIYNENKNQQLNIEQYGDTRNFWVSRYLEPLFQREFFAVPNRTDISTACTNTP